MSQQLDGRPYWFALVPNDARPCTDAFGAGDLLIPQGSRMELRFAAFFDPETLRDLANVESAKLVIRQDDARGRLLVTKTIGSDEMNPALTLDEWRERQGQHFTIVLEAEETNWPMVAKWQGKLWWEIALTTTGGQQLARWGAGRCQRSGISTAGESGVTGDDFYNQVQSNARFAPIALVGDVAAVESELETKADAAETAAALALKATQTALDATNLRVTTLEQSTTPPLTAGNLQGPLSAADQVLPDPTTNEGHWWQNGDTELTGEAATNWEGVVVPAGGRIVSNGSEYVGIPADAAVIPDGSIEEEKLAPTPKAKLEQFTEISTGDNIVEHEDEMGCNPTRIDPDGTFVVGRLRTRVLEISTGPDVLSDDVLVEMYLEPRFDDWLEVDMDEDGWICYGRKVDGTEIGTRPDPSPTPEPTPTPTGDYVPLGKGGLSALPKPAIGAHRGCPRVAPSESLEGFELVASMPGDIGAELDARTLGDGTLAIEHDSSVDGVSLSNWSLLHWRKRALDQGSTMFANARAATLDDILSLYGNKRVIYLEIKSNNDASAVVAAVRRHGISSDYVLFFGFENSYLTTARSFGYKTLRLLEVGESSPSSVVSAGHTYVGLDDGETDERIEAFIEAGLKVYVYTVNKRWIADRVTALGVHGIISDDPIYIRGGANATRATDPFALNGDWHGMMPLGGSDISVSYDSGKLVLANTSGSVGGKILGWAAPGETATITMDVEFSSGTDYFQAYLGTDDRALRGSDSVDANGYAFRLTKAGVLSIERNDEASWTTLDTDSTAAISNGQTVPIEISISPTGLAVKRTDTNNEVTSSDTTHRPLTSLQVYVYRLTVKLSNVTIG